MAVSEFFQPDAMAMNYAVRLLPGQPLFFSARIHRIDGESFFCHKELSNGKWIGQCHACDQYSGAWGTGGGKLVPPSHFPGSADQYENAVRSIKPVERYYYNVVPRGENILDEVKIFSIGRVLHQLILGNIVGNADGTRQPLGDVTHPVHGRDLCVVKTMNGHFLGSGGMTYPDYGKSYFAEPSLLGDEKQVKQFLDLRHDLSQIRKLKPEKVMLSALRGVFGVPNIKKKKRYRVITEPFEPGW